MTDTNITSYKHPSSFHFLGLLMAFFIGCYSSVALADSIQVKTDRSNIEMGDIITLLIQTDFQTSGSKLDLSELKTQFDIINKQQSNQVEIVNGSYNSYTRWRIKLLPKQTGTLTIPAFKINEVQSNPQSIKVSQAVYVDSDRPYFLEAKVDKTQAFVQEQIIYTLRFYHKGSLINGNIRPPKFDNALVESLKEQSVYGKTINGKQYTVYEWQYALFPQNSGQMKIPGPSFTGLLNLRSKQKGVQAVAEPTIINVMSAPQGQQGRWLPASDLKITQEWRNLPQNIKLGDSLRRVITLEVEGLMTSQLSTIHTPNSPNYKVYADQDRDQQSLSERGVTSVKIISQAIVPSKAGPLQIPDEKITWWNTTTQEFQTVVLKSQPLMILDTNDSADPNQPLPIQNSVNGKPDLPSLKDTAKTYDQYYPTTTETTNKTFGMTNNLWPIITLVITVLWLFTLLILVNTRRKLTTLKHPKQTIKPGDKAVVEHIFNHQWCDMPLQDFYTELLRQLNEDLGIKSIDAIPIERLRSAIYQLESHLFAGQQLGYDTQQIICDNWAALLTIQNKVEKKKGELNALYGG